jgi:hypothetical protein
MSRGRTPQKNVSVDGPEAVADQLVGVVAKVSAQSGPTPVIRRLAERYARSVTASDSLVRRVGGS